MKKIFCLFALVFAVLFSGMVFAAADRGEEYLGIFVNYLLSPKPLETKEYSAAVKKLTVDRYKDFIRKYPDSSFVPEAKLRIAEFYDIVYERQNAKVWLDDIIKNHPDDEYYGIKINYISRDGVADYSGARLVPSGKKTASWALYYRALWFPKKNG